MDNNYGGMRHFDEHEMEKLLFDYVDFKRSQKQKSQMSPKMQEPQRTMYNQQIPMPQAYPESGQTAMPDWAEWIEDYVCGLVCDERNKHEEMTSEHHEEYKGGYTVAPHEKPSYGYEKEWQKSDYDEEYEYAFDYKCEPHDEQENEYEDMETEPCPQKPKLPCCAEHPIYPEHPVMPCHPVLPEHPIEPEYPDKPCHPIHPEHPIEPEQKPCHCPVCRCKQEDDMLLHCSDIIRKLLPSAKEACRSVHKGKQNRATLRMLIDKTLEMASIYEDIEDIMLDIDRGRLCRYHLLRAIAECVIIIVLCK